MRKCTFVVFLLSVCLFNCHHADDETPIVPAKKGEWKRLKDYPGEERYKGISFVIGGKAYMGLGVTATNWYDRTLWEYDPGNDSWTQKKDYPFELSNVAAITIGDKGYLLVYSGDVYEYDAQKDTWTFTCSSPLKIRTAVAAISIDDLGYFGMGNSIDATDLSLEKMNDWWMFDPAKNQWTQKASLPGVPRAMPEALSIGHKGYVGLGAGPNSPPVETDFYEYDPVGNTWTKKKDYPNTELVTMSFSNASAGYIGYVSSTGTARNSPIFKYDPPTDQWLPDATYPEVNCITPQTFTIGSRIFVVGGFGPGTSKEVWEFIP